MSNLTQSIIINVIVSVKKEKLIIGQYYVISLMKVTTRKKCWKKGKIGTSWQLNPGQLTP